tara:strand:+ start:1714 stop:2340 length:627 start_codon:yes stop_codon:yes gene_type:complete
VVSCTVFPKSRPPPGVFPYKALTTFLANSQEQARGGLGNNFVGPHRVWLNTAGYPRSGGLAVSRAFGDLRLEKAGVVCAPEITVRVLGNGQGHAARGDTNGTPLCVVLASDGVWDHVSSQSAASIAGAAFAGRGDFESDVSRRGKGLASTHHGVFCHQPPSVSAHSLSTQKHAKQAADAISGKATRGWRDANTGGYRDDITVAVVPLL